MGYHQNRMTITARVSRHNDERDQADDALWDEMTGRIRAVLADPRYADIEPTEGGY